MHDYTNPSRKELIAEAGAEIAEEGLAAIKRRMIALKAAIEVHAREEAILDISTAEDIEYALDDVMDQLEGCFARHAEDLAA